MSVHLVIGSRKSKLALKQSQMVAEFIQKINSDINLEIKKIQTKGDKITDVPLAIIGGKGLFVKEIEESLLKKEIDLAVHSLKDMPVQLPEKLHVASYLKRELPNDAFISKKYINLQELPLGAIVGTSSLRRVCQIHGIRSDITTKNLRGNVDTRLTKLEKGEFDAIIIAAAGLIRLGWKNAITQLFHTEEIIPAVGQGIIAVECRKDDLTTNEILKHLNNKKSEICARAERSFLETLGGGCQIPIGAYCYFEKESKLQMIGIVGSIDGTKIIKDNIAGKISEPEKLGRNLAENILAKGGKKILQEIYMVA